MEYGYINEGGYLVSKEISEKVEKYKDDETGDIRQRIVSIEEQLSELGTDWKPVDILDESKLVCEAGFLVRIAPEDTGDRISFRYDKVFDRKAIQNEIKVLKDKLSSTESEIGDYKITKCYEAVLLGKTLPYDVEKLHVERQAVRAEINRLEEILNNEVSNI